MKAKVKILIPKHIGETKSLVFMIGGILIDFHAPLNLHHNLTKEGWQNIVDMACDVIGIERREVYCGDLFYNNFSKDIEIPLSFEKTFGRRYYTIESIFSLNNIYEYADMNIKESNCFSRYSYIDKLFYYLKSKGIIKNKDYYEPSHEFINKLIKLVK